MIVLPAQNPLFFSHPSLEGKFNRYLFEALSDTDWLWRDLAVKKDTQENERIRFQKQWSRLQYHGLAEFFTEITYYLAYLQALILIPEAEPNTLLFHESNIALRMVACWDRMGFFLYEHFQTVVPKRVYLHAAVRDIIKNNAINESDKFLIREIKEKYDNTSSLRDWRHIYVHRHGEYFRVEKSESGIVSEYFRLDKSSQDVMSKELISILLQSFPELKSAMKSASELID